MDGLAVSSGGYVNASGNIHHVAKGGVDVEDGACLSGHRGPGSGDGYANTNREWPPKYRRRRKEDEGGGGGGTGNGASARSSNSSIGAISTGHSKPSPASPNQTNLSRNDSSASSSGNQVAGGRGSQQSSHAVPSSLSGVGSTPLTAAVQAPPPQQHFDLEASSFPPLPANQSTSHAANPNLTSVHHARNNGGPATVGGTAAEVSANDTSVRAPVVTASAWGESRLADVVKGTAKTAKSSTPKVATAVTAAAATAVVVTAADKDQTNQTVVAIDEAGIPTVSANTPSLAVKITTSQSAQSASFSSSSNSSSASKTKAIERGDEANVISMAKPSQRHDQATAHQHQQGQPPAPQQLSSTCLANSDVTVESAAAAPPNFTKQDMSNMVQHPKTKNIPVIKQHLNADISTKTDGSLVNGIDDGNHIGSATTTENLVAMGKVVAAASSTTRNAATMTMGAEVSVSSTSTMTAFVTKQVTQSSLTSSSTSILSGATITAATVTSTTTTTTITPNQTATKPNASKQAATASAAIVNHSNDITQKISVNALHSSLNPSATLVSPTAPKAQQQQTVATSTTAAPNANDSINAATDNATSAAVTIDHVPTAPSTRLSYAQVAQHNKERLHQDTPTPTDVQMATSIDKVTDKHDKELKRKDSSPNSANTHVNDLKERSGKL